jgi:hypothetical protein
MDAMDEFRKRLEYLRALEKKARRLLLRNEIEQAVKILKYIISDYKKLGVREKAKLLEDNLKNLLIELNMNVDDIEEITDDAEDKTQKLLQVIESMEKKVRRRILQGKPKEAIEDLKFIIAELREHHLFERADVIEMNLNQYIIELSTDFNLKPSTQEAPPSPPIPTAVPPVYDSTPQETPSPEYNPQWESQPYQPKVLDSLDAFEPRRAPIPANQSPVLPEYPPTTQPIYPPSAPSTPLPPSPPSGTIKDQPLSDEEILLKKLLEIKTLLGKGQK